MAGSKNAKKRRSKNLKKQNAADSGVAAEGGPEVSPIVSRSSTRSPSISASNEIGAPNDGPGQKTASESVETEEPQSQNHGPRSPEARAEEPEEPEDEKSRSQGARDDVLQEQDLEDQNTRVQDPDVSAAQARESDQESKAEEPEAKEREVEEREVEEREAEEPDVQLPNEHVLEEQDPESQVPDGQVPDDQAAPKLEAQEPLAENGGGQTTGYQLDELKPEEHRPEDWGTEVHEPEPEPVEKHEAAITADSKYSEVTKEDKELRDDVSEQAEARHQLGAPFEESDYPTLRGETEAMEPEESTGELLDTPGWHTGSNKSSHKSSHGDRDEEEADYDREAANETKETPTIALEKLSAEDSVATEKEIPEEAKEDHEALDSEQDVDFNDEHFTETGAPEIKASKPEEHSEDARDVSAQPEIPQRSVARDAETGNVVMLEAKRQPLTFAKPVMLKEVQSPTEFSSEQEQFGELAEQDTPNPEFVLQDDDEFDPDLYFDEPEDAIVVSGAVKQGLSPSDVPREWPLDASPRSDLETRSLAISTLSQPDESQQVGSNTRDIVEHGNNDANAAVEESSDTPFEFDEPSQQSQMPKEVASPSDTSEPKILREMTLPDPVEDFSLSPERDVNPEWERRASVRSKPGMIRRVGDNASDPDVLENPFSPPKGSHNQHAGSFARDLGETLTPPLPPNADWSPRSKFRAATASDTEEPLSSPNASPRPYKYAQSPLPDRNGRRAEPPIFGVCVVGFHHQRGPEVEYWVGPEESRSSMWPYLPFQSLPDGSHQFEENICYFTLLYDRNKSTSASLTFSRDETGHIKEGTSDFRDVTTLFAIACSRQMPLADLEHVGDDEEYTRSIVQKSVVVIASKPIFGPIKEKLAMVTRSFFDQRNFGDHAIIDHLYANLLQMPLWVNENDLQVGMNLKRFVRDFGEQVLVILKAMLLEVKILFYASDTDILGTTQFALVSLIPNLINHLEDCGSPLLSSYELNLQPPESLKSSDRSSLLKFVGFPLQLFAGGGVLAPFVPLQQFDDLRQPETRYGMIGTTNNLFLGTEIDFDMVVNIDKREIQVRNPDVAPLLKLTEADKAFTGEIINAVNKAWDAEDRWEPTALVYHGGEDYIRHEFEEYLIALLASAKYSKFLTKTASETESTHTSSSSADERDAASAIQHWGKPWVDKWMSSSNNFRIFDKNSDDTLFHFVETSHPGVKLLRPTGFEKFLGLFRPKRPPPLTKIGNNISTPQVQSPIASVPSLLRTPSVTGDEKFDSTTPPLANSETARSLSQEEK